MNPHYQPYILRTLSLAIVVSWISMFSGMALAQDVESQRDTGLETQLISSDVLGYNLQYWVYTPPGYELLSDLPVLFLSDGAWYKEDGDLPELLDRMIEGGEIEPVVAVFLDARVPENTRLNRRNGQFFCNTDYMQFYREEFIPSIDDRYKTRADRSARTIAGLSFGGLNSACFGLYAHDLFEGIAMQSPATHPIKRIHPAYADSARLPLNIFLSSGDHQDNEEQTRKLRDIFREKGYPMKYLEVPFAHNWANWGPLLDDLLLYYYAPGNGRR